MKKHKLCLVTGITITVITLLLALFVTVCACKDAPTMQQVRGWEKISEREGACGNWTAYLNPERSSQIGFTHPHKGTVVLYGFKEKGKEVRVFVLLTRTGKWQECAGHDHPFIDKWLDEVLEKHRIKT